MSNKPCVFVTVKIIKGKCKHVENWLYGHLRGNDCKVSVSKAFRVSDRNGVIRRYRLSFQNMDHAINGRQDLCRLIADNREASSDMMPMSPRTFMEFTWIDITPIMRKSPQTAHQKENAIHMWRCFDSTGTLVGYYDEVVI